MIPIMRTINECIDFIRGSDPDTALTKHALRQLVVDGVIPSVKIGNKYLLNIDTLNRFLQGEITVNDPFEQNLLRKIEEGYGTK